MNETNTSYEFQLIRLQCQSATEMAQRNSSTHSFLFFLKLSNTENTLKYTISGIQFARYIFIYCLAWIFMTLKSLNMYTCTLKFSFLKFFIKKL